MASAGAEPSKGGKRSEPTMRKENAKYGFPIFVDPNREAEYRDKTLSIPTGQDVFRSVWEIPKVIPHRFDDGKIAGEFISSDTADELAVRALLAEGFLRKETPEAYTKTYNDMYRRGRIGIRIDKETGCWLPSDGQLSNYVYRDSFAFVYGLRLDGARQYPDHNLQDHADGPAVLPKDLGTGKNPYKNYIRGDKGPVTMRFDLSHRCHNPFCLYGDHICVELHNLNDLRKKCVGPDASGVCSCMLQYADMFEEDKRPGLEWLTQHSCLVNPQAEPICSLKRETPRTSTATVVSDLPPAYLPRLLEGPYADEGVDRDGVRIKIAAAVQVFLDKGVPYERLPYVFLDMRIVDEFMFAHDVDGSATASGGLAERPKKYYMAYKDKVSEQLGAAINAMKAYDKDGNLAPFEAQVEDPVSVRIYDTAGAVMISPPARGGPRNLLVAPKRRKR